MQRLRWHQKNVHTHADAALSPNRLYSSRYPPYTRVAVLASSSGSVLLPLRREFLSAFFSPTTVCWLRHALCIGCLLIQALTLEHTFDDLMSTPIHEST